MFSLAAGVEDEDAVEMIEVETRETRLGEPEDELNDELILVVVDEGV